MSLTFKDIKNLDLEDNTPINLVILYLLRKHMIDVNTILTIHTSILESEVTDNKMKFEEACVNILQLLDDNPGWDKKEVAKRAIHTFNMTQSLPKGILDKKYDYSEEDKQRFDEFYKKIYGTNS